MDIGSGLKDCTVTDVTETVLRLASEPELARPLSDDEQATNLVRN